MVGKMKHFIAGQSSDVPVDAQDRAVCSLERRQRLSSGPGRTLGGSLAQEIVERFASSVSNHGAVGQHAFLGSDLEASAHQQRSVAWVTWVRRNLVHGFASQALDEHAHVKGLYATVDHAR